VYIIYDNDASIFISVKLHWCMVDLSGSVDPRQVTEVRVSGNTHNVTVDCLEVLNVVTECNDLRWTHKRAETHVRNGQNNLNHM